MSVGLEQGPGLVSTGNDGAGSLGPPQASTSKPLAPMLLAALPRLVMHAMPLSASDISFACRAVECPGFRVIERALCSISVGSALGAKEGENSWFQILPIPPLPSAGDAVDGPGTTPTRKMGEKKAPA
jgi:hypothetical protein